jgi:hypothetical protein
VRKLLTLGVAAALSTLTALAPATSANAGPGTTDGAGIAATCTMAVSKYDNVRVRTQPNTSAAIVTTLNKNVGVALIYQGPDQCGWNVVRGGSYTTCAGGDLWVTVQFTGSDPGHIYYVGRTCVSLI